MNLPNKLTVIRILLAPIFLLLLLWEFPFHNLTAGLVFGAAALTDMFDGKIARSRGLITNLGKFLDPLADKMLTTAAFLGFLAAGRLDAAEGRGQELRSLVLKRDYTYSGTEDLSGQISELKTQLQTLRKQAASSVKTIKSPRSGLFSAVVDGYESVLTPECLDTLTPSGLDTLTAGEIPANTGKLILGDSWYYAGTLSAKDAETLKNRSSHMTGSERLYLRFTKNVDRDLEVELVSIGQEENGRCVAVFRGNTYLQELTLLRRQSAEIVLDSTDGIRVPRAALRSAVREVTETDPETEEETTKQVSVTGVYCVSGAKAVFKPVEVLYTGEDYAVVRTTADAEAEKLRLRPGDEVIVAARDLYDGKVITSS